MKLKLLFLAAFGLVFNLLVATALVQAAQLVVPMGDSVATAAQGLTWLGLSAFAELRGSDVSGLVLRDEIARRLFLSEIVKQLWANNDFLRGARVDTAALDASVVEIPQENRGVIGTVENATELPLQIMSRENDVHSYGVRSIVTQPQLITLDDQRTLTYDKMAQAALQHANTITNRAARLILNSWTPTVASGKIVRSTGADVATALASGATGNRKALVEDDIWKVRTLFAQEDVSMEGARMLVPSVLLPQLLKIEAFRSYDKRGIADIVGTGALGKIAGFEVYERSTTMLFDADGNKKPVGSASATTDNLGILFYNPSHVRMAQSAVQAFLDPAPRPDLAGGRSLNARIVVGGSPVYADYLGAVALVQG